MLLSEKMKKFMLIIGFLILFVSAYAQEIGYSDKIEEAIVNCRNCNICPDGKIINDKICIYFFWGQGCPHCAEEKPFLEEMKMKYPQIEIYDFEVFYNKENENFWKNICEKYGIQPYGVPMTFIGDKVFVSFVRKESLTHSPLLFSISLPILGIVLGCIIALIAIFFFLRGRIKVKVKV